MSRPMIRIHNTQTNEIIDREMNDDELAEYQANVEAAKIAEAEAAAKEAARQALLDKLGITADELKLLLG